MMHSSLGVDEGMPVDGKYFYFHKVANRDTGGGWGGLAFAYSEPHLAYLGMTTTSSSFATWQKILVENASGNVGINKVSPSYKLDVNRADAGIIAQFQYGSDTDGRIQIYADGNAGSIGNDSGLAGETIYFQDDLGLRFYTSGSEAMRLDTSNQLGIGMAPDRPLNVNRSGDGNVARFSHSGSTGSVDIYSAAAGGLINVRNDAGTATINIDARNDKINLIDDIKLTLGTGNDLQIFHDGTDNYIKSVTSDQDFIIQVNDGGSYMNAIKVDSSEVGSVYLPNDNQYLGIGAGNDLRLWHDATNSYVYNYQGELRIGNTVDDADTVLFGDDGSGNMTAYLTLDGSATAIKMAQQLFIDTTHDGNLYLTRSGGHAWSLEHDTSSLYWYNRTINEAVFKMYHAGSVVINEGGDDAVDFRVEGDSDANLLFTDASADRVGIGTDAPLSLLNVRTSSTASYPLLVQGDIDNDGGYTGIQFGYNGSGYQKAAIHIEGTSGYVLPEMHFLLNSTSSGVNTQTLADAKMSITNAGLVGIGTSSPTEKLTVAGAITSTGALTDDRTSTASMDFSSGATRFVSYGASGTGGYFQFRTAAGGASSGERMRLEHDGDLHLTADVVAYSSTPSDIRLKKNFEKIENGLDVVNKLEGHTFNWKKNDKRLSAGFKAQEVEKILPHLIDEKKLPLKSDDDKEYKVLRYEEIIPYLVEAIKEQQVEIDCLKANLDQLKYNRR